jgi:hypothetical protein
MRTQTDSTADQIEPDLAQRLATSVALHEALQSHPALQRPVEQCTTDELITRLDALRAFRAGVRRMDRILGGAA